VTQNEINPRILGEQKPLQKRDLFYDCNDLGSTGELGLEISIINLFLLFFEKLKDLLKLRKKCLRFNDPIENVSLFLEGVKGSPRICPILSME
jgi:hypothetical protein